ncbi:uncharacterized protein G2W53_018580 [Senna tora]|uniref:Uncharacterized protein n=1 Tax=Senna tora TaxID=362788 RepID=A0A834TVE4_9FABA|nr:uncharacterized protein G2W53_018580 [Senna tora]
MGWAGLGPSSYGGHKILAQSNP